MTAPRISMYLVFGAAGLVASLAATNGFDVWARVRLSNASVSTALQESLYFSTIQWFGTLLLAAPFVATAILGAELAQRTTRWKGIAHFVVVLTLLGLAYFSGHWSAQQALLERKWTAAALSVGLLPFISIPIIIAACIAYGIVHWWHDRTAERNGK